MKDKCPLYTFTISATMTSLAGFDGMPGAWYRPIRCFGSFRTSRPTFDQAYISGWLRSTGFYVIALIFTFSGFDIHLFRRLLLISRLPSPGAVVVPIRPAQSSSKPATTIIISIVNTMFTITKFTRMGMGQSSYSVQQDQPPKVSN